MKDGFAISHVRDSRESVWLCSTKESATTGRANRERLVIVDMPEEIAEEHRYRFADGTAYLDNYLIPWEIVNAYRPFRYELCRPD